MREVKSADNLVADVEGDIEDVDGVLKITKIRLRYRFKIPPGSRDKVDRALETYADNVPPTRASRAASIAVGSRSSRRREGVPGQQ